MGDVDSSKSLIEEALLRADSDPVRLPIRKLLEAWDAKRRGYWIVSAIEHDLQSAGLTTQPSFKDGWIDNPVAIVRASAVSETQSEAESPSSDNLAPMLVPRAMLRVDDLSSAHGGVIGIDMSGELKTAQSLMLRHDYSQLAVTSGPRSLRGAVTWESIAVAHLRKSDVSLPDAMLHSEPVGQDRDLLELIPRIVRDGFVFVFGEDRNLCGIITVADLSLEFLSLATPYFLLGEIERRLRRILDERIPVGVFVASIAPGDATRSVHSASDLTFGEYVRILEDERHWALLQWGIERKIFVDALIEVKDLRNEVMHFSPDPFGEDELRSLRTFISLLRQLDPRP